MTAWVHAARRLVLLFDLVLICVGCSLTIPFNQGLICPPGLFQSGGFSHSSPSVCQFRSYYSQCWLQCSQLIDRLMLEGSWSRNLTQYCGFDPSGSRQLPTGREIETNARYLKDCENSIYLGFGHPKTLWYLFCWKEILHLTILQSSWPAPYATSQKGLAYTDNSEWSLNTSYVWRFKHQSAINILTLEVA